MKNTKKIFIFTLFIIVLSMSLVGCGSEKASEAVVQTESTQSSVKDITEPIAETPILVTSAGQSADFDIAKTLLEKVGKEFESNGTMGVDDFGDNKALVVAVGGSSKGLGAAGIDPDDEIQRISDVIDSAKEQGIPVIALHTGGEGRRGTLSDKFVDAVLPKADYIVIVSTADMDGHMSGIAADNDIPMASVGTMADVIGVLSKTFK